MKRPTVSFFRLDPRAQLPTYANPGDSGMDLKCLEAFSLASGERKLIMIGLACLLPEGFEGQIRPRSGNALKKGVTVLNAPGTIDFGYRGQIGVLLYNADQESAHFAAGDRIAQFVIAPVAQAQVFELGFEEFEEFSETKRGSGGFGSTGV